MTNTELLTKLQDIQDKMNDFNETLANFDSVEFAISDLQESTTDTIVLDALVLLETQLQQYNETLEDFAEAECTILDLIQQVNGGAI
jgi:hypothetical protein